VKEYKVLRNCQYKSKMWVKDRVVSFDDNEIPPYHFELIQSAVSEPIKADKPVEKFTLSSIGKIPEVVGGMNVNFDGVPPQVNQKRRKR